MGARALLVLAAVIPLPAAQQAEAAVVDTTKTALEKWVETRRIAAAERRDWALGHELLSDRIAMVTREVQALRDKAAEADKSIGEADKKKAELAAEDERGKVATQALRDTIATLEKRAKELLPRLPDPVVQRVKPLSQRIPEPGSDTKQSLGERFQNIVGVLNELNKFHRQVTVVSEIRKLADGSATEVTAIYLGLAQGFYVNANATIAGTGAPGAAGWTWTPANEIGANVAHALAICKNEKPAGFVQLPVQVK
jgi:hypothetical protein